ncbi:hypothetical protein [Aminiphilus sp.]|jgi:hypothetical protein|uniref:hypothetical protein n=1 Tax=Aminiphilus sp. TaxID=1872488 RepID=UPI002616CB55|nr:hypothetical protein [Aminiphilus sp.]
MERVLKVYMERPGFGVGCCPIEYGRIEMESFPMALEMRRVGELLRNVRDHFGESVRLELIDPRNVIALKDVFRFRIRSTEVVWILDGKLLLRGIPSSWDDLRRSLDAALGTGNE